MNGKVVLITGATGGLGNSVTQAMLETGAHVVGVSRRISQADFQSPCFFALPGEIATAQGAQTVVDQVLSRYGRLDVLAHLVGGFAGGQSVAETDDATFQKMFDLNVAPVFYMLRAAIQGLDLGRIHVHAQHLVAHLGQTGTGDQAHVAGAENGNAHQAGLGSGFSSLSTSA